MASFTYDAEYLQVEFEAQGMLFDSLLWTLGDGSISADSAFTYTYSSEGDYEVCLTVFNSCGEVTVCDSVNVQDLVNSNAMMELSDKVTIYPNPVSDLLYIEGLSALVQGISLEALDGRSLPLVYENMNGLLTLQGLASLPDGIYLLRIQTSSGTLSKRLLISR
jgi:hypothetical protein